MQAVQPAHTRPEMILRKNLFKLGVRYRVDVRPESSLRIKADIVIRRRKLAIFVDGCFWHGCPKHFRTPKSNTAWWKEKIEDNIKRDRRNTALLKERGWNVIRVWEHELLSPRLRSVLRRVSRSQNL